MADKRCKIVIFALVLLVAVILLGVLVAHKSSSSNKMCEKDELYFTDEQGGNGTGTCYPENSKSVCSPGMILVPLPTNKSVGVCDCDSESNPRAIVYHAETKSCHFIFRQAYCAPGEWLTIDRKSKQPTCMPNPCLGYPNKSGSEIVQLKDKRCVELGQPDSQNCTGTEVVKFFKNKIYPACKITLVSFGGVGNIQPNCPAGTYNSPYGGCQPEFDFD